ncbi:hypothetical protein AHF37_08388 [Paragonimus kellicotti]|nr:hypothetical protein AHF37_08388 [Paragonimus kellicotti]
MQLSDPFQTQLVSGVSKMQKLPQIHHQQHGRPVGSRIVSVVPQPKSEIEDSKNVGVPVVLSTSSTRPSSALIPNQMQLSDPFQTQLVSGVSKMQKLPQIHHQQHGRPVGSRIVSVVPQPKSEIEDSKNVGGSPQWVAGPATMTPPRVHPEPMQPFHREESMGHEKTKVTGRSLVRVLHPAGREQHMINCRLINRTQSWGGSLRLAGVDPFCNGEWEVTHSMDSGESPNTFDRLCSKQHPPLTDSSVPKKNTGQVGSQFYRLETTGDYSKALQMRHADWRVVPYVSMPNVTSLMTKISRQSPSFDEPGTKQNVSVRQNELTTRDFKPPLAKRPRMVAPAAGESKWVATSYVIDTDDDELSTGTATVDEFGSIRSELVNRPVTQLSQNEMFSYHSGELGTETSKYLYGKQSLPFRPDVGQISYGFGPVESSTEDRMSTHSSMGTASRTMSINQSERDSTGGSGCNEEEDLYKTFRNSVSQNDYSTESEAQINNDPLARRNPMTRINVDMLSNVLPNQSSPIREQVAIHGTRDGSVWSGRGPVRPAKQRLAQANLVYEYEA